LATGNFETIAERIIEILKNSNEDKGVKFEWMVLEPARGAHVVEEAKDN
jgi:homoserine kinase